MKIRTYTELMQIPSFLERYRYLRIGGDVGKETFGWERYYNQKFYNSDEWRSFRREIIVRDFGCDLADPDHPFGPREQVTIHHMNPITVKDIVDRTEQLMNPEFVICCRDRTHKAIHYGNEDMILEMVPVERRPYDTCPWRL